MERHFKLSDEAFEKQFEDCSLNAVLFSHEAHLRLAWIHVKKYGVEQAVKNVTQQIKEYALAKGATTKYNETLTVAAVRAVYHFMLKSKQEDFTGFIEENSVLNTDFKRLISQHYSSDIFTSEIARKTYIEPELIPLIRRFVRRH